MFFMGFLKLTVPADTGGGQKQMNCLSGVILAPDSTSDCLGMEVWFRHNPGNTATCNYSTPDLLITADALDLNSTTHLAKKFQLQILFPSATAYFIIPFLPVYYHMTLIILNC